MSDLDDLVAVFEATPVEGTIAGFRENFDGRDGSPLSWFEGVGDVPVEVYRFVLPNRGSDRFAAKYAASPVCALGEDGVQLATAERLREAELYGDSLLRTSVWGFAQDGFEIVDAGENVLCMLNESLKEFRFFVKTG